MLKETQKGNKVEKAKKEMFKKITMPVSFFANLANIKVVLLTKLSLQKYSK